MRAGRSKVKKVLAQRGISAAWLARQIGIHRTTLENIEAGRRNPPEGYYERVAGILNVPVSAVKPDPEPERVA